MKLFLASFLLAAFVTASASVVHGDEPVAGGSGLPRSARFTVSPAQELLTARAREERIHREAVLRHYDWIGYNYGAPTVNAGVFYLAQPPVRTRPMFAYPGVWVHAPSYGF